MTTAADPSALDPVLAEAPHRVTSVTLAVRDLERVALFYERVIGLRRLSEDGGQTCLGTSRAVLLRLLHRPDARPRNPCDAGLFHTAFLLPERRDLGVWLDHAKREGIALDGAADHTVSEAVYVADPEGNGIEIYVDRPSATWPRANGTIAMANDRLDFPGLDALASGRRWCGFPAGGIVGHVHLQVGALPEAEAFYGALLGLAVTCRYPGASFFGSGGYHHQLAANHWNSRGAEKRGEGAAGLAAVELAVDGAVLEAVRLKLGSARIAAIVRDDRIVVPDPWGNVITLRAD